MPSFLEDRQGRFWVGTIADGLVLYDREAGPSRASATPRPAQALRATTSARSPQTTNGTLWVATDDGLCRLRRHGTFTCPGAGPAAAATPSSRDELYALHAMRDGGLWAGGRSGLVHYDPDGVVPLHGRHERPARRRRLRHHRGRARQPVAEHSGGLSEFDLTGCSRTVWAWAAAERTLGTGASRAPDGRLYVGGTGGLLAFYPRQRIATATPIRRRWPSPR